VYASGWCGGEGGYSVLIEEEGGKYKHLLFRAWEVARETELGIGCGGDPAGGVGCAGVMIACMSGWVKDAKGRQWQ
jgi:hypothetical protein